ncbi:hypothetical protein [Gimesia chilikensis]|uniref:hypothetical protein n=1 Tax=Gimesia chilikensis TaxID=2605989 RepID=UPI003A91240D
MNQREALTQELYELLEQRYFEKTELYQEGDDSWQYYEVEHYPGDRVEVITRNAFGCEIGKVTYRCEVSG